MKLATALLVFFMCLPQAWAEEANLAMRTIDAILERHADKRILVIGELHGTEQIPLIVALMARRLSAGEPVVVALEIPKQEQTRLISYLESAGSDADRRHLLSGEFWKRPHEKSDGRRSVAMLGLIENLRLLRTDGRDVAIVAFDDLEFHAPGSARDRGMAKSLIAASGERPKARLLVLTGNYHARFNTPTNLRSEDKTFVPPLPMAADLVGMSVASIDVGARAGDFWGCAKTCGPQKLSSREPQSAGLEVAELDPATQGYHLRIKLPTLSHSPPAAVD